MFNVFKLKCYCNFTYEIYLKNSFNMKRIMCVMHLNNLQGDLLTFGKQILMRPSKAISGT